VRPGWVSLEAFTVYAALAIGDAGNPSARYILAKRLSRYCDEIRN